MIIDELTDFRDKLVEFYFDVRSFLRVAEDYDSRYITYIRKYGNNVKIKLFCLDPSFSEADRPHRIPSESQSDIPCKKGRNR